MAELQNIADHLIDLYGQTAGQATYERLLAILDHYRPRLQDRGAPEGKSWLSQGDSLLITYADQVQEPGKPPLETLAEFCKRHLAGLVSGIHILPFFPWSSDDGFSVVDYRAVNPDYGDWEDIANLAEDFHLMFDAVINHISAESDWFQGFLNDDPKYVNFFITVEGDPDLAHIVRPRALPLLTEFDTPSGTQKVWTTFSEDQVDLNYRNPDVLLGVIETLLLYVEHGADLIRLDAIAYLWKDVGTPSIHLPQTHRVIQLFRSVLDAVAPHVLLITETNVPHEENISYFGDGYNEAQLVYNFALPPLVMHTFRTGNSRALSGWAADLRLPPGPVTFFNFLASHDGIGLNPARGILSEVEIEALVERTEAHGGHISYKYNPDGTQSPYELNINYFDALSNPDRDEPLERQVDRFLASQAIMLCLMGIPGIYFHSLFGSRGWPKGVRRTGRSRSINREKLDRERLERELNDPASLRSRVFGRYAQLLRARAASPAFQPYGDQRVLDCGEAIFALLRASNGQRVACLHNVSEQEQFANLDLWETPGAPGRSPVDLITRRPVALQAEGIALNPYQVLWLATEEEAAG